MGDGRTAPVAIVAFRSERFFMILCFRRATSLLLLAAIGTIAFLGENLHLLSGGHHGGCHCAATSHRECCHHDQSHDHAAADSATHGERASLSVSSGACPICQFLAQFRHIDPPAAGTVAIGWTANFPLTQRLDVALERPWRDLARGPPPLAASLA